MKAICRTVFSSFLHILRPPKKNMQRGSKWRDTYGLWIHDTHPFWCKKYQPGKPGKDLQVMKIAQDHHITGVKPMARKKYELAKWQPFSGSIDCTSPLWCFSYESLHPQMWGLFGHPKIHGVWSGVFLQNDWYPKLNPLKLASILDGERPNPGCSSQPPNGREPSCQVNRTPKNHVSVAPVPSPDSSNASENGWHTIWQVGRRELHW